MLSLVEEWRVSGLTQKVFCSLRGIKVSTLCYWVSRSQVRDLVGLWSCHALHWSTLPWLRSSIQLEWDWR